MKANELRIGSLINALDSIGVVSICGIRENGEVLDFTGEIIETGFALSKDCSPIPLTEEWLVRFGFQKAKVTDCYGGHISPISDKNNFAIRIKNNGWHNGFSYSETKYVHQLQNLFYALTGEELTVKL